MLAARPVLAVGRRRGYVYNVSAYVVVNDCVFAYEPGTHNTDTPCNGIPTAVIVVFGRPHGTGQRATLCS